MQRPMHLRMPMKNLLKDVNLKLKNYLIAAVPDRNPVTIYLNEVLLVADPEQLVKTMCHELKHCVQYQSLTNNIWGYSPQRIAQFLYSWREYVSCDSRESYEAYLKQIIEIDANKYVDRIFNA